MQPGQILSRKYRLVRRIAEGGMGEVWEARHERTHCEVAVKILLPVLARNAEARLRFVREARATARVQHPGIIRMLDAAAIPDGRPYLVMELLRGESLAEKLARDGRLSPLETCTLFAEVSRALGAAHHSGVCHRDLSTANVFLVRAPDGGLPNPKIVDFGVSKIDEPNTAQHPVTLTGSLLGSPAYMSPEQAAGADGVDARTDIWSLGVLLYQALSGTVPFRARSANAVLLAVLHRPHVPLAHLLPDLDPALAEVVEGCLVKDREHRVGTAIEIAERLERVGRRLATPGVRARLNPQRRISDRLGVYAAAEPREGPRRASLVARGVPVFAAAAGLCGVLVGLGLGASWFAPEAAESAAVAPAPRAASAKQATVRVSVHGAPDAPGDCRAAPPKSTPTAPPRKAPDLAVAVAEGLGLRGR